RPVLDLSEAALHRLAAYDWPGNVRELKNAIGYAVATLDGDAVQPWDLPDAVAGGSGAQPPPNPPAPPDPLRRRGPLPIAEEIRQLERARIQEALEASGGVQRSAAELIGMPLRTFVLKLKQYGLQARDAKRP